MIDLCLPPSPIGLSLLPAPHHLRSPSLSESARSFSFSRALSALPSVPSSRFSPFDMLSLQPHRPLSSSLYLPLSKQFVRFLTFFLWTLFVSLLLFARIRLASFAGFTAHLAPAREEKPFSLAQDASSRFTVYRTRFKGSRACRLRFTTYRSVLRSLFTPGWGTVASSTEGYPVDSTHLHPYHLHCFPCVRV